jgi:hypothetical protein
MTASLLKSFQFGPAAPRVVLLPDHRFFVRSVPVAEAATTEDVAGQVELALETLSPFPPAQLYHGYFWTAGSSHALIFASYRKRFSSEQTAEWGNAELVIPSFATLAAVEHQPATTLIVPSAEGMTAIHWANGAVPSRVIAQMLPAEADEAQRTQARDTMLKAAGESRAVIDLTAAPEVAISSDEKSLLFRAGEFTARIPIEAAAALDVRDKDELAALRRARSRDLILWRVFAGCAIALGLLLLGEIGLLALGRPWQRSQMARVSAQQPVVDKIMTAQTLATRIEELSTKRLLPVEMLDLVKLTKEKRGTISFIRVAANNNQGLYTLRIDAQTPNATELDAYSNTLSALPEVADVKVERKEVRAGATSFTLVVTFKPGAIKPRSEEAPAEKAEPAKTDAAGKSEPTKAAVPTPAAEASKSVATPAPTKS